MRCHSIQLAVPLCALLCLSAARCPTVVKPELSTAEKVDALLHWYNRTGGVLVDAEIGFEVPCSTCPPSKVFLRSTRALPEGHTFVVASAGGVTTVDRALQWPRIGPAVKAFLAKAGVSDAATIGRWALTLLIAHEACYNFGGSSWAPYWDVLPNRVEGHGLTFTPAEAVLVGRVSALKDSFDRVLPSQSELDTLVQFMLDTPALFGSAVFTSTRQKMLLEVKWASAIFASRYIDMPQQAGGSPALIPVLDLLSHSPDAAGPILYTSPNDNSTGIGIGVSTRSAVGQGEELFTLYAHAGSVHGCNARLLSRWGFTLHAAPSADCAFLPLNLTLAGEHTELQGVAQQVQAAFPVDDVDVLSARWVPGGLQLNLIALSHASDTTIPTPLLSFFRLSAGLVHGDLTAQQWTTLPPLTEVRALQALHRYAAEQKLRLQSEVVNVRAAGASSRNVQNILEVAEGAVRAVDNLVVLVDRAWAAGLRSSAGAEL